MKRAPLGVLSVLARYEPVVCTPRSAVDFLEYVRAGNQHPLAGARYPEVAAVGSQLAAKLLGSHQRELARTIDGLCARPFDTVIDVGCAAGYYAVGFARRLPAEPHHLPTPSPVRCGSSR